jgi:hypothetical protein
MNRATTSVRLADRPGRISRAFHFEFFGERGAGCAELKTDFRFRLQAAFLNTFDETEPVSVGIEMSPLEISMMSNPTSRHSRMYAGTSSGFRARTRSIKPPVDTRTLCLCAVSMI